MTLLKNMIIASAFWVIWYIILAFGAYDPISGNQEIDFPLFEAIAMLIATAVLSLFLGKIPFNSVVIPLLGAFISSFILGLLRRFSGSPNASLFQFDILVIVAMFILLINVVYFVMQRFTPFGGVLPK